MVDPPPEVPLKLLVVDDREAVRYLLRRSLEPHTFVILEADSVEAAQEALAFRPRVLVLDMMLSGTTGVRYLQTLRQTPEGADLKVVMYSAALRTPEDRLAALRAGADVVLLDPWDPEELVLTVRRLAEAARTEDALRMAVARLEAADQRRTGFLAQWAHELRNPLMAISAATTVLSAEAATTGPGLRARQILQRQTRQLARLVEDVLDASRMQRDGLTVTKERLELSAILRHLVEETMAPVVKARGQRLSLQLPDEPLWLQADPARLEQILVNVVGNASKYSAPGDQLWVRVTAEKDAVEVSVEDPGIGLEPGSEEEIFGLFARASHGHLGGRAGLGVGLSVARELARLHGGDLTCASGGPGRGSRFTLRLPLAAAGAPSAPEAQTAEAVGVGLRVLVVDGSAEVRDSLKDLCELWGHRVETAADGRSALQRVLEATPDIAIIDLGLVDLRAGDLASTICRRLGADRPHLLALTGQRSPSLHQDPFDACLSKPVDGALLRRALGRLRAPAQAVNDR